MRKITRVLHKNTSTISREIKRNKYTEKNISSYYDSKQIHQKKAELSSSNKTEYNSKRIF